MFNIFCISKISASFIFFRKKHVSFARSHTMASFDDAYSTLSSSTGQLNKIARSQERLLDVRKTEFQPITKQPEAENFLGNFSKIGKTCNWHEEMRKDVSTI